MPQGASPKNMGIKSRRSQQPSKSVFLSATEMPKFGEPWTVLLLFLIQFCVFHPELGRGQAKDSESDRTPIPELLLFRRPECGWSPGWRASRGNRLLMFHPPPNPSHKQNPQTPRIQALQLVPVSGFPGKIQPVAFLACSF